MVSSVRSAVHLERDDDFAGRYRVIRELASGGMAAVYQVLDTKTDRLRALKLMLPELAQDADLRGRFLDEASVVGRVRSDHIVEVVDAGIDGETPFLVMELLVGEDLGSKLTGQGEALEAAYVTEALRQLALGLDKVHEEGVVHRDLKPENIFATQRDDGSLCIKILDFGIAKVVSHLATLSTTRSLGTPLYMSPEQLRGEGTVDPSSDLYALGHVAFTLLVGKPYWFEEARRATSVFSFVNRVLDGVDEPASERARRFDAELPSTFDAWFSRSTHPDPTERYETAEAQVAALADVLAGRAVAAPPEPSTAPPVETEPARPRWPFVAVVCAVLGLAGALAFSARRSESTSTADRSTATASASVASAASAAPDPDPVTSPGSAAASAGPPPTASARAAEEARPPAPAPGPARPPPPRPAPPVATSPPPAPSAYDPLDEL